MTLNTEVFGDMASCRATGEWMKSAGGDVTAAGTVLQRVRADSETVWRGEAGEAFRQHIGKGGQDADELNQAVIAAGDAMITFADDQATVENRISQARQVAFAEGLTVTRTGIEPPGPAPIAPMGVGADAGSIAVIQQHADAVAAHDRKVAAWTEVQATVADARAKERGNHQALARSIREQGTFIQTMRGNSKFLIADLGVGAAGQLHKNATKWGRTATQLRSVATTAQSLADNPTMSAAGRDAARRIALERANAARAIDSNARLLGPLDRNRFGRGLLGAAGAEFGDRIKPGGGVIRGAARIAGKLPVVGTALTAAQTYSDIKGGKPAGQAIASNGAGLVASTAATSAGIWLAGAAAGGPVTFGIVAAGIGVGMGVSYAVDNWDDIEAGADKAWDSTLGKLF